MTTTEAIDLKAPCGPAPAHVAIIMDGNGRWAKARGLPRTEGHRRGADSVRRTVEAAVELQRRHGVDAAAIAAVEVTTFHEATRLAVRRPRDTEEAQYSLPYPVAAALVRGGLGPGEVSGPFDDADVLRLAEAIEMGEDGEMNRVFPGQRLARVALRLSDGRRLESPITQARGDPETPLSTDELIAKFHAFADPVIGADGAAAVEAAVFADDDGWVEPVLTAPAAPVGRRATA